MSNVFSCGIRACNRIVVTIRKHNKPQEALAGAAVGVRVEKPLDDGVVVSGLQVIEARLCIVVVAAGAKMRSIQPSEKSEK